jgi:hypothetical protein
MITLQLLLFDFLQNGADGWVAITITEKGLLCALKFHYDATAREKEMSSMEEVIILLL